jgi:tight adherence protein C
MPLGALLLFVLCGCSLALAFAGVKWLEMDLVLRERIAGQALVGAGQGGGRRRRLRVPRVLLARGKDLNEIEKGLRRAGYFQPRAAEVFVWLRFAAALAIAALTLLAVWLVTGNPVKSALSALALFGLSWIGAKYVLHIRANRRERVLMVEFPFLLDLMLMMLESGISLDQVFRGIARDERATVPHHAQLMGMLVEDLDRGQDYQVTFERWATRVDVSGAKELASLFRQSMFQGMELVPALREFIREFSQRRVMRAKEAIGTITVRMVILMLVFFMPALFIVLAGPPVAAIFDTLRSAKGGS